MPFRQTLGFTLDRRVPLEMGTGFAIGGAAMLGVFVLSWLSSVIQVTGFAAPDSAWWMWLLFLVFAAGVEELLNRSFLLKGLIALLGGREWVAVAVSAFFFGFAHLENPNATSVSVASNSLGGVMSAVAVLGSGRIWMPWARHLAWNFFQGQIFGFPVSGLVIPGLVQQSATGPAWITGGAYGPEAGTFGIVARFAVLAALFGWFRWRHPEKSWRGVMLFSERPGMGPLPLFPEPADRQEPLIRHQADK